MAFKKQLLRNSQDLKYTVKPIKLVMRVENFQTFISIIGVKALELEFDMNVNGNFMMLFLNQRPFLPMYLILLCTD